MKKIILLLILVVGISSCENFKKGVKEDYNEAKNEETVGADSNEKTNKQSDGLTLLSGEFSYYKDAAVLQVGNSSIYGVILNDKMHELYALGDQFRTEPTDGVIVQIRGKIIPKTEGEVGWDYTIDIKEIISVKEATLKTEVIKIGK